jgi:hypothetical protein
LAIAVSLACFAVADRATAARHEATRLVPKNTFIFARIADLPDLKERFQQTAFGRMVVDPQIAPLVQQVLGAATESLADAEQKLGMTTKEILAIPQGEIALAFAASETQQKMLPILVVDVGSQQAAAEKFLESAVAAANGAPAEEETYQGTKLASYIIRGQTLVYFFKDGTLAMSLDAGLAKSLLNAWDDKTVETLADNDRFAAVMRHCTPANGQEPQLSIFADPVGAVRAQSSNAWITAMITTMGLDGLMAVGGSMNLADGEFDTLMHLHVLLDNPRTGVLGMIAMTSGDSTPERWVPGDAAAYLTIHWDALKTFKKLSSVVDSFSGEGFLAGQLRAQSEKYGVDFEKEVLPALAGRVTQANWMERPITVHSQVTVLGVQLKDASAFQKVLDNFVAKQVDKLETKSYGGVAYYVATIPMPEERPWRHASFGIVGDYLLIADRPSALERAILTQQGEASATLASALEFKLVANKIARQPGGKQAGMIGFQRPEESFRYFYDIAASDMARDWLRRTGERNKFFKQLGGAMETNPLPPFSAFTKYLAPKGSLITDEESGLHYTSFGLRRE